MTTDHVKAQEAKEVCKKNYEKPTLEKLGNVAQLTQGATGSLPDISLAGSH